MSDWKERLQQSQAESIARAADRARERELDEAQREKRRKEAFEAGVLWAQNTATYEELAGISSWLERRYNGRTHDLSYGLAFKTTCPGDFAEGAMSVWKEFQSVKTV